MMSHEEKPRKILKGFIVFEGLDGAGTTTQSRLLAEGLTKSGRANRLDCEPTGMETGKLIRRVLSGELSCHPGTLAALFVADRYEHIHGKEGILSRLEAGELVISDRYIFSSLAYQSLGVDFDTVFAMNALFPLPEYLVFIETDPGECEKRLAGRSSKEIFETLEQQRRVEALYHRVMELFADSGMQLVRLDGMDPPEILAEKVWSSLF